MTNHRVGKTNRRDPRPWRMGKLEKKSTARYLRHRLKHWLRDPGSVD